MNIRRPKKATRIRAIAIPTAIGINCADCLAATPGVNVQIDSLSPFAMFMAADIVVKAVMIALASASFLAWTIYLAKLLELRILKSRLAASSKILTQQASLQSALDSLSSCMIVAATLAEAARQEVAMSALTPGKSGIKERVRSRLGVAEARTIRAASTGIGILASIGSTAPFVGLFGTVWGIMNSFIGISKAQTTNLAIVAPGIAEALLATAIGLVAAIPAVMFYNHLVKSIGVYRALVLEASEAVYRIVSRDLDRVERRLVRNGEAGYGSQATV